MSLSIARRSKRTTDRVVHKNCSRRLYRGHDVSGGADHQGRNEGIFDDMGDETYGLMTKRSVGDEQGEVYLGFDQLPYNCGCQILFNPLMAAHSP